MNNLFLKILPLIYRSLPIPGWLANSINAFLNIKFDRLQMPFISHCRSNIKILINNPLDLIQRQLYFQGYFEYRETKIFEKHIKSGMIYLDIGANIGWHTLVASKLIGASGTALAFEPVLKTYKHLEKNINLNNLNNVKIFRCALSDTNGSFPIYPVTPNNDGSNSLFACQNGLKAIEIIDAKIGSEVLQSLSVDRIDFCKIDVEGAEIKVLKGLDPFFRERRIKTLMIELNEDALKHAGCSGYQLFTILNSYGFNIIDIRSGTYLDINKLPSNTNLLCTYI